MPPLLEGDVLRLGQVVYNLVGNALKFTGAGGRVALRLQVAEGPGGGEPGAPETASGAAGGQAQWLRLSVEDTGCGIHPENVERIFDSFEQEDDQVARLHGGTGLGLAITKRLVELMGGAIGVESEVGRGSVFSAVLPFGACAPEAADAPAGGATAAGVAPACAMPEAAGVPTPETPEAADAPANVPPEAGSAPAPASASASAPASGQDSTPRPTQCPAPARPAALGAHGPLVGRRLLVVEDTPLNLEIARELLEMGGARVETATDGREALARFSASPPGHFDAVLMDVQMPVMDGYEATEALRALARPDARTVPVIALTARAFRQDEAESLSHGMDGHISKPLDARTIYDTMNGFHETHSRPARAPCARRKAGDRRRRQCRKGRMRRLLAQIMKFGVVGAVAFVIDYGLLALLTEAFGVNYLRQRHRLVHRLRRVQLCGVHALRLPAQGGHEPPARVRRLRGAVGRRPGHQQRDACGRAWSWLGAHYLVVKIVATLRRHGVELRDPQEVSRRRRGRRGRRRGRGSRGRGNSQLMRLCEPCAVRCPCAHIPLWVYAPLAWRKNR